MNQIPFHASHSDRKSLDSWILDDPEASFLMQMQGDSMQEHGIHHGDMLVVERAAEARANDLVITVRDGGWMLNTYQEAIGSKEPLTIQAVLKALVRKYT